MAACAVAAAVLGDFLETQDPEAIRHLCPGVAWAILATPAKPGGKGFRLYGGWLDDYLAAETKRLERGGGYHDLR